MKLFKCDCGYQYIVGDEDVFGPIIAVCESSGKESTTKFHLGRMMSREDFDEDYSDCARNLLTTTAQEVTRGIITVAAAAAAVAVA
jgi:hypothetical protein